MLIPLVLVIFWIGIYPRPFLGRLNSSVQQIVRQSSAQVQTGYDLLRSQVYRLTGPSVGAGPRACPVSGPRACPEPGQPRGVAPTVSNIIFQEAAPDDRQ